MRLHPLFWETVYAGDHIELKRHKIEGRGQIIERGRYYVIDGKTPRVIFSMRSHIEGMTEEELTAAEERFMWHWQLPYEDNKISLCQHKERKNFYLLTNNKEKGKFFLQVLLADDESQEELPGRWRIVHGNHALTLYRNERSGQYALYSRLTQNWLFLPRYDSKAVQQWETLYEDDGVRVRRHKSIEPLYVLIDKRTGSLLILLAINDEHKLEIGTEIGVVIPLPGGL